MNEIQISLDTAIEEYFADITKNSTIAFVDMSGDSVMSKERLNAFFGKINFDTIFKRRSNKKTKNQIKTFADFKHINPKSISGISIFKGLQADSVHHVKGLANKIIFSMHYTKIKVVKSAK